MAMRIDLGPKRPPSGVNTRTVCEMLGWSLHKLFGHVRRGELPPPDWWGQEMLWPLQYTAMVRRYGLSLPGTYPGFLPGTDVKLERRRWYRIAGGRCLQYTADKARAVKKASKKVRHR